MQQNVERILSVTIKTILQYKFWNALCMNCLQRIFFLFSIYQLSAETWKENKISANKKVNKNYILHQTSFFLLFVVVRHFFLYLAKKERKILVISTFGVAARLFA